MLCYNFPIKTNRGDGLLICDDDDSGGAEYDSRNWVGRKQSGLGKLLGKSEPLKIHDIYGSLYIFPEHFSKAEYEPRK